MALSFVLCSLIGWVYRITHRGASYTPSYVHTLVLNGMVVAVVMLIVGSSIARAFALVGALSITKFYLLAAARSRWPRRALLEQPQYFETIAATSICSMSRSSTPSRS